MKSKQQAMRWNGSVFTAILLAIAVAGLATAEEPAMPEVGDILDLTIDGVVWQYEVMEVILTAPEPAFVIWRVEGRGEGETPPPEQVTWSKLKKMYS